MRPYVVRSHSARAECARRVGAVRHAGGISLISPAGSPPTKLIHITARAPAQMWPHCCLPNGTAVCIVPLSRLPLILRYSRICRYDSENG